MPCTITGKKPSELSEPVVSVGLNDSWLIIETNDGKVCKIRPGLLLGLLPTYEFVIPSFSGSTIDIPLIINEGKLPDENSKVQVFTNGSLDYQLEFSDYSIIRNGVGVQDQISFSANRDSDDILIRFNL
jgi:hypothetical protein